MFRGNRHIAILLVAVGVAAAACSPDDPSAGVRPGQTPPGNGNHAPSISGTPSPSAEAGREYSFTPTASDADQDPLTFSIQGKPAWAQFDTSTGALFGTPPASGSFATISISVVDSHGAMQSLPAFTINVTSPGSTGTAALSWTPPTHNTDGSVLTDLAGYFVYHGENAASLDERIELQGAGATSYEFSQLPSGTHYFAVSAYNSTMTESARTGVASKAIP